MVMKLFCKLFAKFGEKRVNILRDMTTINENIRNARIFSNSLFIHNLILLK